jgi:hypothetical protein
MPRVCAQIGRRVIPNVHEDKLAVKTFCEFGEIRAGLFDLSDGQSQSHENSILQIMNVPCASFMNVSFNTTDRGSESGKYARKALADALELQRQQYENRSNDAHNGSSTSQANARGRAKPFDPLPRRPLLRGKVS